MFLILLVLDCCLTTTNVAHLPYSILFCVILSVAYVFRFNVIVWRVLFSFFVYVLLALVCAKFSLFLQRWLILQYTFKYVYDAIVLVWYLFGSFLFYMYCTRFACFGLLRCAVNCCVYVCVFVVSVLSL